MTIKRKACIAGAYEHPTRKAPDKTVAQLHAECARGALADAGLTLQDVDGYFCAGDAPGLGANNMADYLGLTKLRHIDTTDTGGSAYLIHVSHAAQAIAAGKCDVALVTLAGRPRSEGSSGVAPRLVTANTPDVPWEMPYSPVIVNMYALAAARHMHEYGTTSEQLAWIKVAAAAHAQHNPNAMLREPVTVEEVLASPMISDPLHKLDCCVVSDGGGALVVVRPEIAARLKRPVVNILGAGETIKGQLGGHVDLTWSGAAISGPIAFKEAGVSPADIQYASIYDSFTITVLMQLEDLGFCKKGEGGRFVADGNLISGVGTLPFNTDGGGLCNNHPANRGGITKVIEAVRQLRGEAHPKVQVPDCTLALAQGTGGSARLAPRQRHPDHGKAISDDHSLHRAPTGTRDRRRRHRALLDAGQGRPSLHAALHQLRRGPLVSARALPLLHGRHRVVQPLGTGHDLQRERDATRRAHCLRDRLRRAR
jgi:acetyl-CoA C-acetyltransferase